MKKIEKTEECFWSIMEENMDTRNTNTATSEAKLFKRCASAPIYNNIQSSTPIIINNKEMSSQATNTPSSR